MANPSQTPDGPWDTTMQRQSGQSLRGSAVASSPAHARFEASLTASNDELRGIRPPLRQVRNRPRFGWPGYAERQPTVEDVVGSDGITHGDLPEDMDVLTSEIGRGNFQGSSRNQMGGLGF